MDNLDEVQRACQRTGVKIGSALERDTRQNIWNVAGNDWSEPTRSQKIDKFISEQKSNPYYADSLENSAPPKAEAEKPDDRNRIAFPAEEFERIGRDGLPDSDQKKKGSSLPSDRIVSLSDRDFETVRVDGLK